MPTTYVYRSVNQLTKIKKEIFRKYYK